MRALAILLLLLGLSACSGGGSGGTPPISDAPPQDSPPIDPPQDPDPDPAPNPDPDPDPDPDPNPNPNDPPVTPTNAFACGSGGATLTATDAPDSYVLFESGPVRPLALSENGSRVLVVNTPANCLEVYGLANNELSLQSTIMVGMEPVAVAFADDNEAWVVNHLSDSISIIDLGAAIPHVKQTLQVGDEPRDIVFAGAQNRRAFITAAYRGQNHPDFDVDDLVQSGLGRADVWVYDLDDMDNSLNGKPLTIVRLFADSPRALDVSPDGSTVYAAAFLSGNASTTLAQDVVRNSKPAPISNQQGTVAPNTGLIVRRVGARWEDDEGTDWTSEVMLDLPDNDLFAIDATADTPSLTQTVSSVGTVLFNIAVNPANGELFVSNLESLNHIRFEGPGIASSTVRGRIAESRITRVGNGTQTATHLNAHIDFDQPEGSDYSASDVERSLSQPTAMVVSPDGSRLYVAAFGSSKVAAIPTQQLRNGSYQPNPALHFNTGGGPSGLVLNTDGTRLLVYTRFDNAVSLWDTQTAAMLSRQVLFNPEPNSVVNGRPLLYDAVHSSANGTSACSSCHIFGDMDQLAWDLGNPDADTQTNPNAYVANSPITTAAFHPMKGPMTTQTFRGMADSGPLHWRGDRTGQNRVTVNGALESLEAAAFKEFNPAFVGLVGRSEELPINEMQDFTDFALAITPPPNPVRALDNSLDASQQNGQDIYFNVANITGIGSCNHCHSLNPQLRQFGTAGLMSFEGAGIAENFKIPSFRNAYAKVGMFGSSGMFGDGQHQGNQIKGFGYLHDGSIATLMDFFSSNTFRFPAPQASNRLDIVRFVMAADSNMAPIVGQQITITANSPNDVMTRLALLEQRAAVATPLPECDLIARGMVDGLRYSALRQNNGSYLDTSGNSMLSAELRMAAQEANNVLTFSCLPPGSGARVALNSL